MTTIVLYEGALCTDRLSATFSNEPGFKDKKSAISEGGSVAIAIGGKTRSQEQIKALANEYELLIMLDIQGMRSSEVFAKTSRLIHDQLLKDTMFILFTKKDVVHMRTLKSNERFNGVISPFGEVYGTGGKPALVEMMYQRKQGIVDHEAIMKFAGRIDNMTSTEHDIIYASSLLSVEEASENFVNRAKEEGGK